jgi:hypothetical protein
VAPGYETTIENVGETSNKGLEISLNAFIIETQDFSVSANFNIGFNRSKVENLAEASIFKPMPRAGRVPT